MSNPQPIFNVLACGIFNAHLKLHTFVYFDIWRDHPLQHHYLAFLLYKINVICFEIEHVPNIFKQNYNETLKGGFMLSKFKYSCLKIYSYIFQQKVCTNVFDILSFTDVRKLPTHIQKFQNDILVALSSPPKSQQSGMITCLIEISKCSGVVTVSSYRKGWKNAGSNDK